MSAQGLFKATGRAPSVPSTPNEHGFYRTPHCTTTALAHAEADRLKQLPAIWDPGVGLGDLLAPVEAAGHKTIGSDLVVRWEQPSAYWQQDLFDVTELPAASCGVVTNPDFSLISPRSGEVPWIEHLMQLRTPYIAMLCGLQWMTAKSRLPFLNQHPPSRVYIHSWRLDWDGQGAPAQSHQWVIWDDQHEGPTELRILSKGPRP